MSTDADGSARVGRGGRIPSAGQAARKAAPVALVLGLAGAVLTLVLALHDRDLSDLPALARTSAQVVDRDAGGKGPDHLTVRFTPAGGAQVQVRIPTSSSARAGDTVDVGYVAAEPTRARTVSDWSPAWERVLVYPITGFVIGVPAGVFGLGSKRRNGRFEADAPVPPAPVDAGLGTRIARSGRGLTTTFAVVGVLALVGLVVVGLTTEESLGVSALVGVVVFVLLGGFAAFFHWFQGRDGVWATETELVARKRGRLQRWPWDQVHELGTTGGGRSGVEPAARLERGTGPRQLGRGWTVLARPLLGPVTGLQAARRLEALAAEHGLSYTEGLSGEDL